MPNTKLEQTGEPWVGTEASYHAMVQAYVKMGEAGEGFRKEALARDEEDEENNRHFLLDVIDGVGVITVRGSMVSGAEGAWGQYWGIVGYEDIRNAIITGLNAGVEELLFDYDTPGGAVKGIMELSDFIKSLDVKTTSFTGGMAASGGLWLATASDSFYAARMAEIGSVGVIAVTSEITELYKDMGISLKVFKSTPLKAAGNPYEKLTAEAAEQIQKNINDTHMFFVREIADNRGLTEEYVSENIANGKVWFAAEANELNLIDGIKTFDEILLVLMRETADNTNNFQHIQDNDMPRRKVITEQQSAAIASGADVDAVLEDSNLESTVEDEGTTSDDAASEESGDEAETADDEGAAADEADSKDDKTEAASNGVDKVVELLQNQVAALQDASVDLKVELKQAQANATALEATHEGLKKVTAVAIQRGFVAIGSPAPAIEGLLALDASALLQQHAQVDAQVSERFGAGKQVSTTVNEDENDAVAAAAKVVDRTLLKQARI